MYIHIGEEVLIKTNEIVAILDKESAKDSKNVEEFLSKNNENIENLSKNPFKSIVITLKKVYLSPIASNTLKKRSHQLYDFEY